VESGPLDRLFVDPVSGNPSPAATEAKLLWDDRSLYIAFVNKDGDVNAKSYQARCRALHGAAGEAGDLVEVMIDADKNGKSQRPSWRWRPNNTILDSLLARTSASTRTAWVESSRSTAGAPSSSPRSRIDGTLTRARTRIRAGRRDDPLPLADANGLGQASAGEGGRLLSATCGA